MTLNQVAEMFGIEPFEGGDRRLQSLNYVSADMVDTYQLNKSKQEGTQSEQDKTK